MIDEVRILRETFVARADHYPAIDSTNNRAAESAARGVKDTPLLVIADEQTAGRGRGSNRWWTGPGALAFSLLLDAETVAAERNRSPLVALAAAVAVAETVAPLLLDYDVGIKWPNDVFCDKKGTAAVCQSCPQCDANKRCLSPLSRKLAGILIEVLPDRRHVIGIGLNTNNTTADAPAELQTTVGTIRDLAGRMHDQTDVLIDLLKRLERTFAELRDEPEKIADRANELCLLRGCDVVLQSDDRRETGLCRGIASDGALLLETPDGVKSFQSGTVASG